MTMQKTVAAAEACFGSVRRQLLGRARAGLRAASATGFTLLLVFGGAPPADAEQPSMAVRMDGPIALLQVSGSAGSSCTVQYSDGLSGNWTYVTNGLVPSGGWTFPAPVSSGASARFFRVFTSATPANVTPAPRMVWIPPGSFVMGSPPTEIGRGTDETQHPVTLTKGFYIGKYLVSQADYQSLTATNPSWFNGIRQIVNPVCGCKHNVDYGVDSRRPVEQVTWDDATNYCALLTAQERTAGHLPAGWSYRLPTEAEWEYACRAGTTTAFCFGNSLHGGMANFDDYSEYNSSVGDVAVPAPTVPELALSVAVGNYLPNAWGLYDTHGNAFEWCLDFYGPYPAGALNDPQGPATGTDHIIRGGSWYEPARFCRSAQRLSYFASGADYGFGFRVVLAPSQN